MKKVKLHKKSVIVVVLVVVLVAVGAVLVATKENKSYGTLVSNYVHPEEGKPTCKAYSPECGVCPGEIVDKKCYVKTNDNAAVPAGYTKVSGFKKDAACLSLSPECGVCRDGIIVGTECYVKE
jgi:hypothetical protein